MTRDRVTVEEYRRLVAGESNENALLNDVAIQLTRGKWRWHHVRRSDRALPMGDPGLPDILALRDGLLLVRELKGPEGRFETGQREWLADFAAVTRVDVGVWRPGDEREIERVLR